MPLPTIDSPNPTSLPAQPAVDLPNSFLGLLHFNAMAGPAHPWTLRAKTINYNAKEGVLANPDDPEHVRDRSYPDARLLAAEFPAVAQVFGGVLVIAGMLDELEAAKERLAAAGNLPAEDETKPDQMKTAQAAVDAARKALGA